MYSLLHDYIICVRPSFVRDDDVLENIWFAEGKDVVQVPVLTATSSEP